MRGPAGVALALCALTAGVMAPAPAVASHAPERVLLARVNQVREAHGLAPLEHSRALARSARRWARHIARTGAPRHADLREEPRSFPRVAELIEWHAGAARPATTVAVWERSRRHKALLLDPGLRWFGAGRAVGDVGGRRSTVWVARLGGD